MVSIHTFPETGDGSPFPGSDDAKRNANARKMQMKERVPTASAIGLELCDNCGAMKRADDQPNFRCPCHKAAYCSRECQVSHRKEHKAICTCCCQKGRKIAQAQAGLQKFSSCRFLVRDWWFRLLSSFFITA
jgi:MYND finger